MGGSTDREFRRIVRHEMALDRERLLAAHSTPPIDLEVAVVWAAALAFCGTFWWVVGKSAVHLFT